MEDQEMKAVIQIVNELVTEVDKLHNLIIFMSAITSCLIVWVWLDVYKILKRN
jgi:hypothetical protein